MEKENNRSAAGLRRSAIAERLRLREEWSALKGTTEATSTGRNRRNNVLTKKTQNIVISFPKNTGMTSKRQETMSTKRNDLPDFAVSEVLRGTVVLVDVGSESKALPLRAALTALGASVVPAWSPLVTHLVWSQGGCRNLRAKARALACKLVSPLWVEACAASGRRLPEKVFPAPTRPSDLPSPSTLKRMLKKAEQENISLQNLLSDSPESDKGKPARLRISSETEHDTTNTTDTSHDTSADKSRDKSNQTLSPDPETRVNTAPRRALPISITPQRPTKSKRKLFTQKEADVNTDDESDKDKETPAVPKKMQPKLTHRGRRELAHAEKIARKLMGTPKHKQTDKTNQNKDKAPRVVLTGMSKTERHQIFEAVRQLNGKVQNQVNKKTTHILMGTCTDTPTNKLTNRQEKRVIMCDKCNTPEDILSQMFINNVTVQTRNGNDENIICSCFDNISGIENITSPNEQDISGKNPPNHKAIGNETLGGNKSKLSTDRHISIQNSYNLRNSNNNTLLSGNENNKITIEPHHNDKNDGNDNLNPGNDFNSVNDKPRTVNALLGAVRGCRILYAQWARDSLKAKRWLHHCGYEVPHLKKISQKARVERLALNKMRTDYAYDVFNGMRVRVSENAEQKDAVNQLLTLCGAITQDGGQKQNGGQVTADFNLATQRKKQNGDKATTDFGGPTQNGRQNQNGGQTTDNFCVTQNGRQYQNGGQITADFDITIGRESGQVSSKWVFDSIAAGRMRTTRRYVNKNVSNDVVVLS